MPIRTSEADTSEADIQSVSHNLDRPTRSAQAMSGLMYSINKRALASLPQAIIGSHSPRLKQRPDRILYIIKMMVLPRKTTPALTMYVKKVLKGGFTCLDAKSLNCCFSFLVDGGTRGVITHICYPTSSRHIIFFRLYHILSEPSNLPDPVTLRASLEL